MSKKTAKVADRKVNTNERTLKFDLFSQLTYMAAVSTAGVGRSELFRYAAALPYVSSKYFKNITFFAEKMNIDYAEACRMEADRVDKYEVRGLLLRMAGSLSSGEDETKFLRRESEIIGETYGNEYASDIESLRKWTDAYVALIVAAGLIVIVAVISMMIYEVGTTFVIILAIAMVGISCLGAWVIYISAPREIVTRVKGPSSKMQKWATVMYRIFVPLSLIAGSALVLLKYDLGWVSIVSGLLILPPGILMGRDGGNLAKKDADVSTMVRVLGGVAAATGSTVQDALVKIDRRSMGALMPEVTRLRFRLGAGIDPNLCWDTFVDEVGSELVERTVSMFWDSIRVGGEPGKVGEASAFFSSKITYLRSTRKLVATTFAYLAIPLHVALVSLLEFILKIMELFSTGLVADARTLSERASALSSENSTINISQLFTFGQVNLQLIDILVTSVVVVLTAANAFAPKAAAGGHGYNMLYNLGVNMILTGSLMLAIPHFAGSMFEKILEGGP